MVARAADDGICMIFRTSHACLQELACSGLSLYSSLGQAELVDVDVNRLWWIPYYSHYQLVCKRIAAEVYPWHLMRPERPHAENSAADDVVIVRAGIFGTVCSGESGLLWR